ncbi:MAG: hypothetical protein V3S55_07990, partial [Nitrospiraceae bacterium]
NTVTICSALYLLVDMTGSSSGGFSLIPLGPGIPGQVSRLAHHSFQSVDLPVRGGHDRLINWGGFSQMD